VWRHKLSDGIEGQSSKDTQKFVLYDNYLVYLPSLLGYQVFSNIKKNALTWLSFCISYKMLKILSNFFLDPNCARPTKHRIPINLICFQSKSAT